MRRSRSLLLVLALLAAACARERATAEVCEQVLDRIVDIELSEQGFKDPALAERKKQELRRRFAPDLQRCVGRPLPRQAPACIAAAATTEALSHSCLR